MRLCLAGCTLARGTPIALFLLGLALGYLYRRTGSLLPCIVVHFLLNAMTMTFMTFGDAAQ